MSNTYTKIWSLSVFIFLLAAYTFFLGFKLFRTKQLIEGTATSKIRSIAIGFAEIYGKIVPVKVIKSPISGKDCVYWRVLIIGGSGKNPLSIKLDKSTTEKFFIQDGTGKILVEPKNAQFERLSVGLSYGMPIIADYPTTFFGIEFPGNLDLDTSKVYASLSVKKGFFGKKLTTDFNNKEIDTESVIKNQDLEKFKNFCEQERIGVVDYQHLVAVEYYLPPDKNMYVLGTVMEDANSPNNIAIKKGEYVDMLYLTDRQEKTAVERLGKRARNWIVCGGAVAILSLFAILSHLNIIFGSGIAVTILSSVGFLIIISRKGLKIWTTFAKTVGYSVLIFFTGALFLYLIITFVILSKGSGQLQGKIIAGTFTFLIVLFIAYLLRKGFRALRSV